VLALRKEPPRSDDRWVRGLAVRTRRPRPASLAACRRPCSTRPPPAWLAAAWLAACCCEVFRGKLAHSRQILFKISTVAFFTRVNPENAQARFDGNGEHGCGDRPYPRALDLRLQDDALRRARLWQALRHVPNVRRVHVLPHTQQLTPLFLAQLAPPLPTLRPRLLRGALFSPPAARPRRAALGER